jgi:hypothetical protein
MAAFSISKALSAPKLEKWTKDRFKIERMHYAGNNLGEAR